MMIFETHIAETPHAIKMLSIGSSKGKSTGTPTRKFVYRYVLYWYSSSRQYQLMAFGNAFYKIVLASKFVEFAATSVPTLVA